jgi:Tfp pilus assembly pilus retraction ATPase PilT
MIILSGIVPAAQQQTIRELTTLRFKDAKKFKTAESLIMYEQRMIDDEKLFEICNKEYDVDLVLPEYTYVSSEFVRLFSGMNVVPLKYDNRGKVMYVGVLPELDHVPPSIRNIRIEKCYIPLYFYVKLYTRYYGVPDFLLGLPVTDIFKIIVEEAVELGAADITITTVASGARIYYNCRKQKVNSKRQIATSDVEEIAKLLAMKASTPITEAGCKPKYLSVQLDMHNRGRVVLNYTYYGRAITIRVLPDEVLTQSLEDLNIASRTATFIRNKMLSNEKGLRLFIGETMSGKNTTILSAIRELVYKDNLKIVSIENPVEILVDGIEQINVETEEEYKENAVSLLRQNPDIVYIAEINSSTAVDTINTSNTGKIVFSSLHANSISDVVARLQDITGMSSDRLLLSLHSCVYQELVRDETKDKIFPVNRCMYFSDELKNKLYGKQLGEIKRLLMTEESKWR